MRRVLSPVLRALGIDAARFWLLVDLFATLSERRELFGQLGRDGMALKTAALMYFFFAGVGSIIYAYGRPAADTYLWVFVAITAFVLFTVLLSEAGNSLVNAEEGLVLAHQPVNGATYTAAKLTHLLRIVLYFVAGLNVVPALAGLACRGAGWLYPARHLLSAAATGIAAGLVCCAIYGWLIRFVPAPRLKTVAQVAEALPFLAMILQQPMRKLAGRAGVAEWLPEDAGLRTAIFATAGLVFVGLVVFGLRSLSADYLVRVSSIVHGRAAAPAGKRPRLVSGVAARWFGGPPGRAAFEYVPRMMRRDWQFRRQLLPMLPLLLSPPLMAAGAWRVSPFSGQFTPMHILPHLFGVVFFWVCSLLPYGSDYKGAWVFQLAPSGAFDGFTRGVHACLWIWLAVLPHGLLFPVFAWQWGVGHAALFTAYSLAFASVYLGLELRLVDGLPFGKQPLVGRAPFLLPLMILGGVAMAAAVGIQYFLVFRSAVSVAAATAALAGAAWLLTRGSLDSFASAMRYHVGLAGEESTALYKEIDA